MDASDRGSAANVHNSQATLSAPPGVPGIPPAEVASDARAQSRLRRARALLALARPRQWVKNALVVGAAGAAGALGHDDVPGRVLVACAAFCLISAGVYALNDVHDRFEDRRHPRKCRRPVASGAIDPRDAFMVGVGWMLSGLILCSVISALLVAVGLAYLALTLTYSWIWRRIVVLDLVALAGGFVLRAVAGGVAAPVGLSRWFVLVVTFAAMFAAAAKRLAELTRSRETGRTARRVLQHYSARGLRLLLACSGGAALFAYCMWASELPVVGGMPWRLLTVIPFAVCLLRYGMLARAATGEAPEEVLLSDRVLAVGGLAWLVVFALSVNAAS